MLKANKKKSRFPDRILCAFDVSFSGGKDAAVCNFWLKHPDVFDGCKDLI